MNIELPDPSLVVLESPWGVPESTVGVLESTVGVPESPAVALHVLAQLLSSQVPRLSAAA